MKDEFKFWADKIAENILKRKSFHYTKKPIPKLKKYTVKTSASLSGVLHIGRLSDTLRGEAVHRALCDAGAKSELIWVAEDMDPLRKVPKGIPKKYEKYIGMSVTDIPDPYGCHESYAEHHVSEYFKVLDRFVATRMKKYSMRKEYKKGNFTPYIKKIIENMDRVIEIQNRYRTNPLNRGWSPWQPVCDNCGKLITPKVNKFENGMAYYKCMDYQFEKTKDLVNTLGLEPGRIRLEWVSAAEGTRWGKVIDECVEAIETLGPSPLNHKPNYKK